MRDGERKRGQSQKMDPSRSVHTELINGNVSNEVGGIMQKGVRERGKDSESLLTLSVLSCPFLPPRRRRKGNALNKGSFPCCCPTQGLPADASTFEVE